MNNNEQNNENIQAENTEQNIYQANEQDNEPSSKSDQTIHFDKQKPTGSYGTTWDSNPYGSLQVSPNEPEASIAPDALSVNADLIAEKKHMSRVGFGYAAFTAISIAVSLIIQIIAILAHPDLIENDLFLNLITPVSLYLFSLPILLITISGNESSTPEKKKFGFGKWLLCFIIGFGVMYIGAFIGNGVMSVLSWAVGYDYSNALNTVIGESGLLVTFIFTVIVAPIGEEFVFRKLIIDRTNRYGGVICVVLSALMFGIMHGNFYQFFYCVGLGLILGYMYYSSGKLLPCILLHSAINFMGGVIPTLLNPIIEGMNAIDQNDIEALFEFIMNNIVGVVGLILLELFIYTAMGLAVLLPILLRKRIRLERGEVILPRGKVIATVAGSAGMILMIAVYVIQFSLSLLPL